MRLYLLRLIALARNALIAVKSNIIITLLCMSLLTAIDLVYSTCMNSNYAFGLGFSGKAGYWGAFALVFISTFSGRYFMTAFLFTVFLLSIAQIVVFDYFGSYILPIHYIQLIPDFALIMGSLAEAYQEMFLAIGMLITVSAVLFIIVQRLSRTRLHHPLAAVAIVLLVACDLFGNYIFITINKEKLGEPSYRSLFPDIDQLGIHNAYRSARYLAIGILPDLVAGRMPDFPDLPMPDRRAKADVNIVLILNESIRAKSLSLLGYELNTTPQLEKLKGLYATTVFSAGTMTRTSFAGLINRLKYPGIGKQFLTQSNCLFRLAKESELNTVFIYSQHRNIADTLLPFMCSNYIDKVLVDSDAPENRRDFDDSIFYNLEQTDMRKSNFIVIGPDGAHTPYVEKSPERFKGFDEEYDNAILYTDSVIASIIENLRGRSKKPTYVIVTSDHGELLKGEDEQRGHGWFKREVVQVPFLFFSFNDPDPESTMAEVRKVRSHFDIATLAIRLMGYNVMVEGEQEREIYINGSDLSGLAGYMRLQFLGGQLRSADLFGGVGETPSIDEFR